MTNDETRRPARWYTIGMWTARVLIALVVFAVFAWAMDIHDEVWGVFFRN